MRTLAIESSTRFSSAALFDCTCDLSADNREFLSSLFLSGKSNAKSECEFNNIANYCSNTEESNQTPQNSSSSLIPAIRRLFEESSTTLSAIDILVISLGPGSFTGLRLGIVTAKTIAYATQCNLVGIHNADLLVCQSLDFLNQHELQQIQVGFDIGRGEVLVFDYQVNGAEFERSDAARIKKPADWYDVLQKQKIAATGSGLRMLSDLPINDLILVPGQLRGPDIEAVAKVGVFNFKTAGPSDFWSLEPIYSRPSAAEEAIR